MFNSESDTVGEHYVSKTAMGKFLIVKSRVPNTESLFKYGRV